MSPCPGPAPLLEDHFVPILSPLFDSTLLLTKVAVNAAALLGSSVSDLARYSWRRSHRAHARVPLA